MYNQSSELDRIFDSFASEKQETRVQSIKKILYFQTFGMFHWSFL